MYAQPTTIDPTIIWVALAFGLLVQAGIIYACIRLALMQHHAWVQAQDKAAARAAKRRTEPTIWGAKTD